MIDFSIPYFHSGVSLLASPKRKSEIPLLAFLLPFSPELWIAIFTSLNITAVAVAVYEWLSPFGLNPWGRQRSKNFSLSSGKWKNFLNSFALSLSSPVYVIKFLLVIAERLAFSNLNGNFKIVSLADDAIVVARQKTISPLTTIAKTNRLILVV